MQSVMCFVINYWLILALIMSLFWGISRAYLDYYSRRLWPEPGGRIKILLNWSTYQFIFNFTGSFLGWCCLYILIMRAQRNISMNFDLTDLVLFIISFLGLTGHLPQSLYGLVESLGRLADVVANKLSK